MIDREQIGIRIAALRKKANLSQAALAEKLDVTAQAVSKWESGKNLPDIDLFRELAWLFHVTIDSIVEGELEFVQMSDKKHLPSNVTALAVTEERRKLLENLAPYCSDTELYNIAKELSNGNMELSFSAVIKRREEMTKKSVSLPTEALGEHTLREMAPYFAKTFGELLGNVENGLRRVEEYLRCPKCGEKLSLQVDDNNKPYFLCKNQHYYPVIDGVVDFGSREIKGELWSLFLKNYDYYLEQQKYEGIPRYQTKMLPGSEARWQELKKRRPRVILDIACGTCMGIGYDLKRINWPCLVITTDLSHRVQKYNKRYFTEEVVNPYVDLVCIACDCANLPVADECIDAVVSCAGFESMQDKMLDGFREGHRVLKKDGNAIYSISVVEDHNSENTQKWERLYRTLPESFHLHTHLNDIQEWKEICRETGYESTAVKQIYGEMPAPKDEVFPFEQEVMQWMGEYLCISRK